MADPYIGEIRMFGGNYAPVHWTFCYGQLTSIQQFPALYSLFGTNFGGDGRTNFGFPDMRGRLPVGQGTGPGLTPRTIGQKFGLETVDLSVDQIPQHTHTFNASTVTANTDSATGAMPGQLPSDDEMYVSTFDPDKAVSFNGSAVNETGSGVPHNNMMPSLGISFILSLAGTYPQRN